MSWTVSQSVGLTVCQSVWLSVSQLQLFYFICFLHSKGCKRGAPRVLEVYNSYTLLRRDISPNRCLFLTSSAANHFSAARVRNQVPRHVKLIVWWINQPLRMYTVSWFDVVWTSHRSKAQSPLTLNGHASEDVLFLDLQNWAYFYLCLSYTFTYIHMLMLALMLVLISILLLMLMLIFMLILYLYFNLYLYFCFYFCFYLYLYLCFYLY